MIKHGELRLEFLWPLFDLSQIGVNRLSDRTCQWMVRTPSLKTHETGNLAHSVLRIPYNETCWFGYCARPIFGVSDLRGMTISGIIIPILVVCLVAKSSTAVTCCCWSCRFSFGVDAFMFIGVAMFCLVVVILAIMQLVIHSRH